LLSSPPLPKLPLSGICAFPNINIGVKRLREAEAPPQIGHFFVAFKLKRGLEMTGFFLVYLSQYVQILRGSEHNTIESYSP